MKADEGLIEYLLRRNREQVYAYRQTALDREKYLSSHPTFIAAAKCSDGRVHIPALANIPFGIVTPFRNIGGEFDFGWRDFYHDVKAWVQSAIHSHIPHDHKRCVFLSTYHWSEGSKERGCRGHGYNQARSVTAAEQLAYDCGAIFGKGRGVVYPLTLGIETDSDAFIFHGQNDQLLDTRQIIGRSELEIVPILQELWPDMTPKMWEDLAHIVYGNVQHVDQVARTRREPSTAGHKEQIFVVGRGVHWIHEPNRAMIVGPYSPNLSEPIATAALQILENLKGSHISDDDKKKGWVLMTSALCGEPADWEHAIYKARSLARTAIKTISKEVPELLENMHTLFGITNEADLVFTEVKLEE